MERDALRRFGRVAGLVLLSWLVFVFLVVPQVIRSGYAAASLEPINQLFAGRDTHPVDFYLEAWRSGALKATASLYLLFLAAFLWRRYPGARRRVIRVGFGDESGMEAKALLRYAALWGAFGGLGEFVFRAARQLITQVPYTGFHWELLWMAPLAGATAAFLVAVLLSAVARLFGSRVGLWQATVAFGFFAMYGAVQSAGIPLYRGAEILLSLGLASAVARQVVARSDAFMRHIGQGRPYFVGAVALLVVFAVLRIPSVAERRVLANLPDADPDLPNILLIILDTVRAANLSLYGYERLTTPGLGKARNLEILPAKQDLIRT